MDKISAIIPVYNRASWISVTLDCILSQSVSVDEIIICDDGSDDDLELALKPFGNRIKIIRIENSGPAIARKTAIEYSTGDWIALCDSDDFWYPDHIASFKKALNAHPYMTLYFTNFDQSNDKHATKFDYAPMGWLSSLTGRSTDESSNFIYCNDNLYSALLEFQCCFPSTCLFSRDLYDCAGGINPQVSRWQAEDAHLTRRLAAYGNTVIYKNTSVMINKHGENFSNNVVGNFEGRIRILEKLLSDDDLPERYRSCTSKEVVKSRLKLFRLYYWHGQRMAAIQTFKNIDRGHVNFKDYVRFFISVISKNITLTK